MKLLLLLLLVAALIVSGLAWVTGPGIRHSSPPPPPGPGEAAWRVPGAGAAGAADRALWPEAARA